MNITLVIVTDMYLPNRDIKSEVDCVANLKWVRGNVSTKKHMTYRCLLANSGNVLERLLVALLSLLSLICGYVACKYNEGRFIEKGVHLEHIRPPLPATFFESSFFSSFAFFLASNSFCCCSILCSFHLLLICKCEMVQL